MNQERLFVGTAEAEHTEMYIKAVWHILEREEACRVNSIAKTLNIKQPSVVQMLKKLKEQGLVIYNKEGINLTESGKITGSTMVRNSRLLEVMMEKSLNIEIDEEMVCGIEHHMNKQFTDALCTMLNHPRKSPHGYDIPPGDCCKE